MRASLRPVVERLNEGTPLLQREETHPWENKVTFNPACALVRKDEGLESIVDGLPVEEDVRRKLRSYPALVFLLYRAQGKKTPQHDHTRSSIGLAVLSPALELLARLDRPVMVPEQPYEDLGIEDPRITLVGGQYMMVYTAYASGMDRNRVRIALASSTDFVRWTRLGVLKGAFNSIDNKNGMLFQPAAGRRMLLLHRPMEGEHPMAIHWADGDGVTGEWRSRGVLLAALPNPRFRDVWAGGGAPPLLLDDGRYLMLYHIGNRDVHGVREYDLGLALLDLTRGDPVVARIEPLLQPSTPPETAGDPDLGVNNVVFVCGAYFWEGDLYFPYAGADSCVLGARIAGTEIAKVVEDGL